MAAVGIRGPGGEAPGVALIGYQDQGNLGMGYLAACLERAGYRAMMLDVRDEPAALAARIRAERPLVVGFSLIFQAFLPQFRRLAAQLRAAGCGGHFTIGGHFPSLCTEETLELFPELDSVVCYEGEVTLVELVGRLAAGEDWRGLQGLAYTGPGGRPVINESRPLIADLDSLPHPARPYPPERIGGFHTLPLLASRGCARRCSFCSIHTFYRTAPGKVVRVRQPAQVVAEMLELERLHQVRIFLFQDDDFPLWGAKGRRWAEELAARLQESGLSERTIFKISCRGEYVKPELFALLRDAGLFLVYMGIESGVEAGLDILHKQMTVEGNRAAVQTLKDLGILFGYGFMLFDPSSSFASIRENLGFLYQIVGDGSAAATFSRMLPYGGTPIRDQLRAEGRLRGDITRPDYVFLDPRINEFHRLLSRAVRPWIHGEGLSYQLNYALDELETVARLVPGTEGEAAYRGALRALTRESNAALFATVEQALAGFEAGERLPLDPLSIQATCEANIGRLVALRDEFIARNILLLRDASVVRTTDGPVLAPQLH